MTLEQLTKIKKCIQDISCNLDLIDSKKLLSKIAEILEVKIADYTSIFDALDPKLKDIKSSNDSIKEYSFESLTGDNVATLTHLTEYGEVDRIKVRFDESIFIIDRRSN